MTLNMKKFEKKLNFEFWPQILALNSVSSANNESLIMTLIKQLNQFKQIIIIKISDY